MKRVAKLIIIDPNDNHLLMYRSDHPTFGTDPDLPGGTIEEGESNLEAMIREVQEEAGVVLEETNVVELYAGTEYSRNGTHYSLFTAKLPVRPVVTISWEHSDYAWLDRNMFLEKAKGANDTYMHMVHDVLTNSNR